jgi:hypothetical protein
MVALLCSHHRCQCLCCEFHLGVCHLKEVEQSAQSSQLSCCLNSTLVDTVRLEVGPFIYLWLRWIFISQLDVAQPVARDLFYEPASPCLDLPISLDYLLPPQVWTHCAWGKTSDYVREKAIPRARPST